MQSAEAHFSSTGLEDEIEIPQESSPEVVEGMGYASKAPRTASERALTLQPASTEPEPASAASVVAVTIGLHFHHADTSDCIVS